MSLNALTDAILKQDRPAVEHYLKAPININERDAYGYTPLIEAAIVNNESIAELLLHHGADPNLQDMTGATALHWACENNNLVLAALLLEHKANPNLYTSASESVLVAPYLRRHSTMVQLITRQGGSLKFAKDYIHAKLLGHRFSLLGSVDIVDPNGLFTEVNLEGFYLEFSIQIILDSLKSYIKNFAAKDQAQYFDDLQKLIDAFSVACQLAHYQQYQIDIDYYAKSLRALTQKDLLIIPVGYEGHAITVIKFHNLLVICNRRRANQFADQLPIYRMEAPDLLDWPLLKHLLFERNSAQFIEMELLRHLQCTLISRIMIKRQITGNCSWANVEAAVPVALFFIMHNWKEQPPSIVSSKSKAITLYRDWVQWDKDRALGYFFQAFEEGDSKEKASIASLCADIMFQRCGEKYALDRKRARRIIQLLKIPELDYILKTYIKHYQQENPCKSGDNLKKLLKQLEDPFA
jgi:hypothetical protein